MAFRNDRPESASLVSGQSYDDRVNHPKTSSSVHLVPSENQTGSSRPGSSRPGSGRSAVVYDNPSELDIQGLDEDRGVTSRSGSSRSLDAYIDPKELNMPGSFINEIEMEHPHTPTPVYDDINESRLSPNVEGTYCHKIFILSSLYIMC